jgi:hypothetical protein
VGAQHSLRERLALRRRTISAWCTARRVPCLSAARTNTDRQSENDHHGPTKRMHYYAIRSLRRATVPPGRSRLLASRLRRWQTLDLEDKRHVIWGKMGSICLWAEVPDYRTPTRCLYDGPLLARCMVRPIDQYRRTGTDILFHGKIDVTGEAPVHEFSPGD